MAVFRRIMKKIQGMRKKSPYVRTKNPFCANEKKQVRPAAEKSLEKKLLTCYHVKDWMISPKSTLFGGYICSEKANSLSGIVK